MLFRPPSREYVPGRFDRFMWYAADAMLVLWAVEVVVWIVGGIVGWRLP